MQATTSLNGKAFLFYWEWIDIVKHAWWVVERQNRRGWRWGVCEWLLGGYREYSMHLHEGIILLPYVSLNLTHTIRVLSWYYDIDFRACAENRRKHIMIRYKNTIENTYLKNCETLHFIMDISRILWTLVYWLYRIFHMMKSSFRFIFSISLVKLSWPFTNKGIQCKTTIKHCF